MKITDIKCFVPWVGHRNQFVAKVETDEGYCGLGESGVSGRELAVEGAVKHFREFLIGKDPMHMGALWQEMYRGQYFEGGRILTGAISAVDIALHDIVARKLDVPVYQLLGGAHRDVVPGFPSVGTLSGPQIIDETQRKIDEGWDVIRLLPAETDPEHPEIFDPRACTWARVPNMRRPREGACAAAVSGRFVMVVGGQARPEAAVTSTLKDTIFIARYANVPRRRTPRAPSLAPAAVAIAEVHYFKLHLHTMYMTPYT